ncbi:MAG: FecR domain-containing protein [Bacteroidota bacterium]
MRTEEIRNLLDKYYAGDTSRKEEEVLYDWFAQNEVPEEFMSEKAQFLFFQEGRVKKAPDYFIENLESKMEKNPFFRSPGNWLKVASAVALLAISVFIINSLSKEGPIEWKTISTAAGEKQEVVLPDGSTVWLNSRSELRYPIEFKEVREVEMKGEAFFEIQRDETKPFNILSQNTVTKVLGTSFNVRSYDKEDQIEVVVVTGKVAFTAEDEISEESVTLEPGLKATLYKEDQSLIKEENSDPNFLSWKTNELNFDNQELLIVLESVSKHYEIQFAAENEKLALCPFTGSFKELTKEEVIRILSYSLEIDFEFVDDTYVITGQGCTD